MTLLTSCRCQRCGAEVPVGWPRCGACGGLPETVEVDLGDAAPEPWKDPISGVTIDSVIEAIEFALVINPDPSHDIEWAYTTVKKYATIHGLVESYRAEVARLTRERDEVRRVFFSEPAVVESEGGAITLEWCLTDGRIGVAVETDGTLSWWSIDLSTREEPTTSKAFPVPFVARLTRERDVARREIDMLVDARERQHEFEHKIGEENTALRAEVARLQGILDAIKKQWRRYHDAFYGLQLESIIEEDVEVEKP